MLITFDNPFCYVDSLGDKYEFYFFYDKNQQEHISIRIEYKNPNRTPAIFGHTTLAFRFAQPFIDGKIIWDAYKKEDNLDRNKTISTNAKQMANKLLKLKAFL